MLLFFAIVLHLHTFLIAFFTFQVPPTLRFVMDGEMPDYLLAKDLILQVSLTRSQGTGLKALVSFLCS